MLFVVSAHTYPLIRLPFQESPVGVAHQAEGPFLKPRCLGDGDMLDTVVLPQGAAAPQQASATSGGLRPTRVCESIGNCPAMESAGSPVLY